MNENGIAIAVTAYNKRIMPEYQYHKKIKAFKITYIGEEKSERYTVYILRGEHNMCVMVSSDYIIKHNPEIGGYYVLFNDSYESYSPAKAFEEGYSLIDGEAKSDTNKADTGII